MSIQYVITSQLSVENHLVPSHVLGTGEMKTNKTDKIPATMELTVQWGDRCSDKQTGHSRQQ